MSLKPVRSALISVYHKDNLQPILQQLSKRGVKLFSTGGTKEFIEKQGLEVTSVEDLTGYPAIFGGRLKTLHPKVFGGILQRRELVSDTQEAETNGIAPIDMVIVDLYPFKKTLESGADHSEIIEKIDIGGISLIRAAAKNFNDVLIVSSMDQYSEILRILKENNCSTALSDRKRFATYAFRVSSHYDSGIHGYFTNGEVSQGFVKRYTEGMPLRYGENPHQQGTFFGSFDEMFNQLHGKTISYNNLVDIDAAVSLIEEFNGTTAFAILKHTNACGVATGNTLKDVYLKAFEADTISAFGGVLATNSKITPEAAIEIDELFFEILIAPGFTTEALDILQSKKNRILLVQNSGISTTSQYKSLLNGVIQQDRDLQTESIDQLDYMTKRRPSPEETEALLFANKIAKHTKSNAIVLAKPEQMISSGVGQTSRVDAVRQAIAKAKSFAFDISESVMASDAFFPFSDSVEIAFNEGIRAIIQPGGSIRDKETIDFCDDNGIAMVFTGKRHFKH